MSSAGYQAQTCYAPAPRSNAEEIERQYGLMSRLSLVPEILEAQPNLVAVLNQNRQIVYANHTWLIALKIPDIQKILGKRPGEAMGCIHSDEGPSGCGTSEACSVCGAVRSILKAQRLEKAATEECRITAKQNGKLVSFNLLIWVTPINVQDDTLYILVASDISHEKRRRSLEKIFFHDLANTAVALTGYSELLKRNCDGQHHNLVNSLSRVSQRIVQEIDTQRELLAAENQEVTVRPQALVSTYFLTQVSRHFELQDVAAKRNLVIDPSTENLNFSADPHLLGRILDNLTKNALEALAPGPYGHPGLPAGRRSDRVLGAQSPGDAPGCAV